MLLRLEVSPSPPGELLDTGSSGMLTRRDLVPSVLSLLPACQAAPAEALRCRSPVKASPAWRRVQPSLPRPHLVNARLRARILQGVGGQRQRRVRDVNDADLLLGGGVQQRLQGRQDPPQLGRQVHHKELVQAVRVVLHRNPPRVRLQRSTPAQAALSDTACEGTERETARLEPSRSSPCFMRHFQSRLVQTLTRQCGEKAGLPPTLLRITATCLNSAT